MTDPLDILDRAHAASTGGEWLGADGRVYADLDDLGPDSYNLSAEDAAFIAAAHNRWPAVAEELRALRELEALVRGGTSHEVLEAIWSAKTSACEDALAQLDAARGKETK